MNRIIRLSSQHSIDLLEPPENLEEVVQHVFADFTKETSPSYTDEDRLYFIDRIIWRIKGRDSDDAVADLIKDRFDYELQENREILDPDDFYGSFEFFSACYDAGAKSSELRCRSDDRHLSDTANRTLVRIIRAVMSWKRPPDPDPGTISIPISEDSIQRLLTIFEDMNAESQRKLFEPGNRFVLERGDRKIEYVAQEVNE